VVVEEYGASELLLLVVNIWSKQMELMHTIEPFGH